MTRGTMLLSSEEEEKSQATDPDPEKNILPMGIHPSIHNLHTAQLR